MDEQWALEKIEAFDAWDISTGSSEVLVGVVDSGIDSSHEALASQIYTTSNPSDTLHREFSGFLGEGIPVENPIDDCGHGTHVAGIIAAESNNVGIVGEPQGNTAELIEWLLSPQGQELIEKCGYARI